jgi:hypothetical protein
MKIVFFHTLEKAKMGKTVLTGDGLCHTLRTIKFDAPL